MSKTNKQEIDLRMLDEMYINHLAGPSIYHASMFWEKAALFLAGEHERVFSPDKVMDRLERVVPHFKKKNNSRCRPCYNRKIPSDD